MAVDSTNLKEAILRVDALIAQHTTAIAALEELKVAISNKAQQELDDTYKGINISKRDLQVLKRLHSKAVLEGRDRLEFKGAILLTDYAKYMIEFTESQFDDARR